MSELYIPRLRRISDTLTEMKWQDPDTVVTRHFIVDLIRRKEITAMKYGDAWLINSDELYGYFSGQKYENTPLNKPTKRTICTSGEMLKLFREQDENTIIRKPNLRRFVKENGIWYFVSSSGRWLIDRDLLLQAVNPKGITKRTEMPRLRYHDDSVRNFKRRHPNLPVTIKIVERAFGSDRVFKTKNGGRWIINYDQLEEQVLREVQCGI